MVAIFATMSLALVAGRYGPRWLAVVFSMICLALSTGLFLYEIYSPDYGFRMPWLKTMISVPHTTIPGNLA